MTGKITKKMDKGFGFIMPEGEGKEIFFHGNDCVDAMAGFERLSENDIVSFEVGESPKGPNAKNVQKVEAMQQAA